MTTTRPIVAVFPRSSGWNLPPRPAIRVERRIYVTIAMTVPNQLPAQSAKTRVLHTWDVHVGAVDVVSRGEVPALLPILPDGLLARPRLVPPGEDDEEELVDDVRVGDVEVVLERRDVDVSAKLAKCQHLTIP
jgi:hypothetical protein